MLHGQPFRFGGANNYYLIYKSQFMVDDLLTTAAQNEFNVLRTWGFLDIGDENGTNSIDGSGKKDGVYFQYWDGSAPAYNDGQSGLEHLDYVIYRAKQLRLRLIIPLVNNWKEFGGMDQYVRWRGGKYHDEFYTDPIIRQWYKAYVEHVLNRINTHTGVAYKDEPTIMAWELANEPRCKGTGPYPPSSTCGTATLLNWVSEMSGHIKSIDENHLVAVGDEGFYCKRGTSDWTANCSEGVDTVAFTSVPTIDFMSLHLYPSHWDKSVDWGTRWITDHIQDAHTIGKPVVLGEFGSQDASSEQSARQAAYEQWTSVARAGGGNGTLFWMLAARQDDRTLYPDYDRYTVYCPGPVCTMLTDHAARIMGDGETTTPTATP